MSTALCGLHAQDQKITRDPFHPVGYKKTEPIPVAAVAVVEQPKTNVNATVVEPPKPDPVILQRVAAELQAKIRERLQVNGFMKSGGQQMAIVNGQIKKAGDPLNIEVDGRAYPFKIVEISPTSVRVEPIE